MQLEKADKFWAHILFLRFEAKAAKRLSTSGLKKGSVPESFSS